MDRGIINDDPQLKLYRVLLVQALQPRQRHHTGITFCTIGYTEDEAIRRVLSWRRGHPEEIIAIDARELEDGIFGPVSFATYSKSEVAVFLKQFPRKIAEFQLDNPEPKA